MAKIKRNTTQTDVITHLPSLGKIILHDIICSFRTYLEIIQITLTLGIKLEEYDEHYCNAFQPTFNEHGFCYTFNNPDASLDNTFQG